MEQNISVTLLINLVNEKYGVLKSQLVNLLKTMSENNHKAKLEDSILLNKAAMNLANILAESDRPGWLNQILSCTNEFTLQHKDSNSIMPGSSWQLLNKLMRLYYPVLNHKWDFSTQKGKHYYDFDAIYKKYRDESKLESLFDALIETLEKMVNSGEIDSLTALNSLNELIELLDNNKTSSYFSTMASWEFVKNFTCNIIWEQLDSIPGIKTIKKAFEKTLSETDIELTDLHKKIANEIKEKYKVTIRNSLSYKNEKKLLESSLDDSSNG